MSTRYIRYFTTALRISAATFLLSHAAAWAQAAYLSPPGACAPYGLNALPSPHDAGELPWWFLSNEQGDSKIDFFSATLPILAADQHVLWGVDSRILTQMKPSSATSLIGPEAAFYIVREHVIKPNPYRGAVGRRIEVIGAARVSGAQTTVLNGVSTVPLVIRTTRDEVNLSDRLLPLDCMVVGSVPASPSSVPLDPTKAAKIKVLLNNAYVGERNAIALIDQGQDHGLAVGQVWQLVDEVSNQPASAKAFGRVRVLQVLEHSSVVYVDRAVHEVEVGTALRFWSAEETLKGVVKAVQP
ncbi:hypothetical protein [Ephemeroptericola cinctiostellae]|nr:hypothetical protein [Ephemeroptericola cinctiostellae]